jgi:hypothetical protein
MLDRQERVHMNDLFAAAFFLACLASGVGLANLCQHLMPRGKGGKP